MQPQRRAMAAEWIARSSRAMTEQAVASCQNRTAPGGASSQLSPFSGVLPRASRALVDGNKRTSFVAAETFLLLNGQELQAGDAEIVKTWLSLAAGQTDEGELAEWLRANCVALR